MSTNEINEEKPSTKETEVSDYLESNEDEHIIQSGKSNNGAQTAPMRNLGKLTASTIWKTIDKPIIMKRVSRAIPWSRTQKTQFLPGVSTYRKQFSFAISNFFTSKTGNLKLTDRDIKHDSDQDEEEKDGLTVKEDDQDQNTNEKDKLHDLMNDSLSGERSSQESHPINAVIETEWAAEEGGANSDRDESTVPVKEEQVVQPENEDEKLCCASYIDAVKANKLENECDVHEIVPDNTNGEHDVSKSLIQSESKDDNSEKRDNQTIGWEFHEATSLMETEYEADLDVRNADIDESTFPRSEDQDTQHENATEKFWFPRDAIAVKTANLKIVPLSASSVSPKVTPLDFELKSEMTEFSLVLENSTEVFHPVSISTGYHKNGWKRRKTVDHPMQTPNVTGDAVITKYQHAKNEEEKASTTALVAGTGAVPQSPWNESSLSLSNEEKQQSLAISKIGLDLIDHSAQEQKDKQYKVIQSNSQPTHGFYANKKGSNEKKTVLWTISAETEECASAGAMSETKSHTACLQRSGVNFEAPPQISIKLDSHDQCESSIADETKEPNDCQVASPENARERKLKREESSQLSDCTTYSEETSINHDAMLLPHLFASRKRKMKLNWTQEEDRVIFEAVFTSTKVPFRGWTDLAQRLPGRNMQQVRNRWNKQLNPKINKSPFSAEDDRRLWNGHKVLGSQWLKISVEHFDSTRSSAQLLYRWKHPLFIEFVKSEFGPDAYESRNREGATRGVASCRGAMVPEKNDESPISSTKAFNENPGTLAHPNIKHHRAKYAPFSNEDNLRLWEAYNTLGTQWARISLDHFNSTRPWFLLKYQMQCSSFEAFIRSRFGSNVFESGLGYVSSVQADVTDTSSSSLVSGIADLDHRHLSIHPKSQKPVDWVTRGSVTLPAMVKRKIDDVNNRGIQPKKSDKVNPTNELLLTQQNKTKRLKVDKKKSDPGNNTCPQAEVNQTTKLGRKFAGTEAGHSFAFDAVSNHGANIKSVNKSSETQFKLQLGDLIRRYVDDGDDDEYPLLGVVLNFNVETEKYTIRYRNSALEVITKNELEEKVLVTVRRIDDDEKVERYTPLHIVFGKSHLVNRIADDSMDRLGNDILHHIASFLPSLESLISFCSTSKQANLLLRNALHSENLFCRLFNKRFGKERAAGEHFRHLTWKDRWRTVSCFRKGFNKISGSQTKNMCTIAPRTVGVLPQSTEESAILYDNPQFGDSPEGDTSHGYFGMQILHNLPKPPNATEWEAPLVVHGDFTGVKIFSSVGDLISVSGISDRDRFLSLGDDHDGQVLSLILSPSELMLTHDRSGKVTGPPCCFIGCASGRVGALCARLTEDGMSYTFTLSSVHAHSCEVTCLSIVNCRPNLVKRRPVLFSACCGGKVYYYPQALEEEHRMDSELAFSNVKNCPIFSMVPIEMDSGESNFSNVLCTGDRSGTISLWSTKKDAIINGPALNNIFRRVGTFKGGRGNHPVTAAKVIRGDILVTGNTNGDLRFWSLGCAHTPKKGLHPRLNLQRCHNGVHTGAVEVCMNVGDVLLTSGGSDGKLVGWDLNSLSKIGNIQCHPGKRISFPGGRGRRVVNSCVISAILPTTKERRLICLCRDGVLVYWTYDT